MTFTRHLGRVSRHTATAMMLFLASSVAAFAQGSAGRISGSVTDQTGGALPAAKVTITDVGRGVSRALTADAAGSYAAPNLTPGNYSVRAEFMGFKTFDRKDIVIEVGQEIRVDVTMQPGDQTQTVTVTGEVAAINTTSAELGGALTNEVINDLPLNGRNFENLLDLRPGVTKYPGNSGWAQSTNGLRPHDNFFMVDGINSNDPWMAQSVMNAVMAAGDAGTMLPIDAIVPTAHGAAMACLDEKGDLALPVMDYTSEPPAEIVADYEKIMPGFEEALCPLLPLALTHGLQIYWQQRKWPEA